MWRLNLSKLGLCFFLSSALLLAQSGETFLDQVDPQAYGEGARFARLTYVDRNVELSRDGNPAEEAIRNMPIMAADALKTPFRSYAEVEFIDGSLMQIDNATELEFQAVNEVYRNESLTVIRLLDGSLFLHLNSLDEGLDWDRRTLRVDTSAGSAYLEVPGVYRIDLAAGRMKLKVFRGLAELSGERESEVARSGEYSSVRDFNRPTRAIAFNSFQADRFERWASDRRPGSSSVSSKYVDPTIRPYTRDLDGRGEWRYSSDLNTHVWVPAVTSDWRPYYNGYWSPTTVALTWVSYDPFGWLTHHYGRWGWGISLGWYWIPDRFYSPGWVSWTAYEGSMGWCPLGYYNRPFYWGRSSIDIGIYTHYRNSWCYLDAHVILRGERRLPTRVLITERPVHRVSNNAIFLNHENRRDPNLLLRTVREPAYNRQASATYRDRSSHLEFSRVDRATTTTRQAMPIESRNTGTRAVSRTEMPVRREGSSIFDDRNSNNRNTTRDAVKDRGDTQPAVRRSAPVERDQNGNSSDERRVPVQRNDSDNRRDADKPDPKTEQRREPIDQQNREPMRREDDRQRTAPVKGQDDQRTTPVRRNDDQSAPPARSEPQRTAPPARSEPQRTAPPPARDNQTQQAKPAPKSEPQRATPKSSSGQPKRSAPVKRDDGGGRNPIR